MPTFVDRTDALSFAYHALQVRLTASDERTVDFFRGQATAYVWGRQDAGEDARDTGYSIDFGYAYGIHAARYALGEIGCRTNFERAFREFKSTGEVTGL